MASSPTTSWQIEGGKVETVTCVIFLGSKITVYGNCSQEIKRCLLLGRKAMMNLDSIPKSRHITAQKGSYSQVQFSCSVVSDSVTPWTAACQAYLSITNSWSLLKLMSIESMVPSNHLSLCCLLILLPSIFPGIRVFSNESALHTRWPKYWSFRFSTSPSNEHSGLIFFRIG